MELTCMPSKIVDKSSPSKTGCTQTHHFNLLIFTILFIVYMMTGACAFIWLEQDAEIDARTQLRIYLRAFRYQYRISYEDMEMLIKHVARATELGISPLKNVSAEPSWGFGQSFFFSGTLIVLWVGYGNISPVTRAGKAFTIIYCLFGIPLCLALLTAFVERLKSVSNWWRSMLSRRLEDRLSPARIQHAHLLSTFTLILIVLFIIPSMIFTQIEDDWTFLDAFYYCFISLTTIGLGDYIPGDHPEQKYRSFYKIITTGNEVYLLIGLCGMMLLLATMYDVPQLNLSRFFASGSGGNGAQPLQDETSALKTDEKCFVTKYSRQMEQECIDGAPVETIKTTQQPSMNGYQTVGGN